MKQQVAYISPEACLDHLTGLGHPERPERLNAVNRHLRETSLIQDLRQVAARRATRDELVAVHPSEHVAMIVEAIEAGFSAFEPDTTVCRDSLEAAYLAAGAALTGIDLLREGSAKRVFCAVRPPGHHAEAKRAMGFCIFNNVAIAAAYARSLGLADRVLILDWDVHHGNGTQHIFESSDKVFYYSLHQYPLYPGTGAASEKGTGAGTGFTLNRPLPAGTGDKEYLKLMEKDLRDIEDRFEPELIIISAGFDAHEQDPLGGMRVSDEGFLEMTRLVAGMADTLCGGKVLSVLEGGYNLDALASSVAVHLSSLLS